MFSHCLNLCCRCIKSSNVPTGHMTLFWCNSTSMTLLQRRNTVGCPVGLILLISLASYGRCYHTYTHGDVLSIVDTPPTANAITYTFILVNSIQADSFQTLCKYALLLEDRRALLQRLHVSCPFRSDLSMIRSWVLKLYMKGQQ